jgi:hypothetical protein
VVLWNMYFKLDDDRKWAEHYVTFYVSSWQIALAFVIIAGYIDMKMYLIRLYLFL